MNSKKSTNNRRVTNRRTTNNTKTINNNMKVTKLNKKIILILTTIILILFLLILLVNKNDSSNKSAKKLVYNKNESFLKKQEEKGITFDNIKCYYNGEQSTISYIISNKTDKAIKLSNYEVIVKDKDGNKLSNIFVDFSEELAPNQEKIGKNIVIGVDLSDAYKMELKLKTGEDKK